MTWKFPGSPTEIWHFYLLRNKFSAKLLYYTDLIYVLQQDVEGLRGFLQEERDLSINNAPIALFIYCWITYWQLCFVLTYSNINHVILTFFLAAAVQYKYGSTRSFLVHRGYNVYLGSKWNTYFVWNQWILHTSLLGQVLRSKIKALFKHL